MSECVVCAQTCLRLYMYACMCGRGLKRAATQLHQHHYDPLSAKDLSMHTSSVNCVRFAGLVSKASASRTADLGSILAFAVDLSSGRVMQ